MNTNDTTTLPLGEVMVSLYEELLELYGDPDIASVAAAAMVNDMLAAAAFEEIPAAAA